MKTFKTPQEFGKEDTVYGAEKRFKGADDSQESKKWKPWENCSNLSRK